MKTISFRSWPMLTMMALGLFSYFFFFFRFSSFLFVPSFCFCFSWISFFFWAKLVLLAREISKSRIQKTGPFRIYGKTLFGRTPFLSFTNVKLKHLISTFKTPIQASHLISAFTILTVYNHWLKNCVLNLVSAFFTEQSGSLTEMVKCLLIVNFQT